MLYRQFYAWADTSTMLCIYVTCIRPHLEYACQLCMGPLHNQGYTVIGISTEICLQSLKQWDMNYESMLEQLDLTPLSQRRKLLKLITMYNIVNGTVYFPNGYFVQSHFPYSSNHVFNYTRPFARTNYLFSSFVPSVVSLWNSLPDHVKVSPLSIFKAHVSH